MSEKPNLIASVAVPPLMVQQYERYNPTAFNDSLTILEKINKMIYQLNKLGEISNDLVKQWNQLIQWILNNGLEQIVSDEIDKRIESGVFDDLFNKLLGELDNLKTTDKSNIVNAINEVFNIATENKENIGDLSNLITDDKTNLVQAVNEIKSQSVLNNQAVITIGEATGHGVISGLKVTQQKVLSMAVEIGDSTTPNIIHMANGNRFTPDTIALPVNPSDPMLDRKDIVFVDSLGEIKYLAGLPASIPITPSLPVGAQILAVIDVVKGDTTINDVDIIDMRSIKTLKHLKTNHKENFVLAINEIVDNINKVVSDINNEILTSIQNIKDILGNKDDLNVIDDTTFVTAINEVIKNLGNKDALKTLTKADIVSAINEVVTNLGNKDDILAVKKDTFVQVINTIITNIGEMTSLTTSDKTSLVYAINEVFAKLNLLVADVGNKNDLKVIDKTTFVTAINEIVENVGDLSALKTTFKEHLVGAINEVFVTAGVNLKNIGDMSKLETTDKTTLVKAINEIFNLVNGVELDIANRIGKNEDLKTTEKTTIVGSINEVYDDLNNYKTFMSKVNVDVKSFGAVGDGVADDTVAIQKAVDSLQTQSGGRAGSLLFFPAGIYVISKPIMIFGNITIQGVGRRGSTILLKEGSNIEAMIWRKSPESGFKAVYWTQIKDICLDGQASLNTYPTTGIKLENVVECLISNVGIRFVRGHGIHIHGIHGAQSIQPTIEKTIIRAEINHHEPESCGIYLGEGSYDGMVMNNDIGFYKQGYGIKMQGHNGAYLTNNNVWQNGEGYHFYYCNRIRLTGCLSDYAQKYGYYFSHSYEFQLSNCQSRWSSNQLNAFQIYDGFHAFNCGYFTFSSCAAFGGNGVDLIDGGKGQTAFGIAMSGTSNIIKINGFISRLLKGDYYMSATTDKIDIDVYKPSNQDQGIKYIGNASSVIQVAFAKTRTNTDYTVIVTPSWDTYYWITNPTNSGFTINFSAPAPSERNVSWAILKV